MKGIFGKFTLKKKKIASYMSGKRTSAYVNVRVCILGSLLPNNEKKIYFMQQIYRYYYNLCLCQCT